MRRFAAVAIFASLAAMTASAQKIQVPAQSSNPNLIITPSVQQGTQDLDKAKRIPREEAMKLVKEKKALFVDVRTKDSYDAGHIKGAISIPESELIKRLKEIPPKQMIITYCA
jgi:3-mercaptopyruvate sulfurtransferase SseA